MGNIGDPMTSGTIPAVGTVGTGYASTVNAFLTEVKQRLEAKLPLSSFLVGLLDMANNAITNLAYILLYPQVNTPTTPTGSLQNFGGDLYWVSPTGAAKITAGNVVNAASNAGITGDYGGANPAQFRFVDASSEFFAYDDFGGGLWAFVQARAFDITGAASGSPRVRLSWGGVVNFTLTLPPALPAGPAVLIVDASGNITTTANPTVDLVMGTNANIKLQGTGVYKHAGAVRNFAVHAGNTTNLAGSVTQAAFPAAGINLGASADALFILPELLSLEQIESVTVAFVGTTGTNGNVTFTLYVNQTAGAGGSGGNWVAVTGASVTNVEGAGFQSRLLTPSVPGLASDRNIYAVRATTTTRLINIYAITASISAP